MYSSEQSSTDLLKNSNLGLLILWESTSTDTPTGTSMKAMEELKDQDIVTYKAPEFQVVVELWERDSKNKKQFNKLLGF